MNVLIFVYLILGGFFVVNNNFEQTILLCYSISIIGIIIAFLTTIVSEMKKYNLITSAQVFQKLIDNIKEEKK